MSEFPRCFRLAATTVPPRRCLRTGSRSSVTRRLASRVHPAESPRVFRFSVLPRLFRQAVLSARRLLTSPRVHAFCGAASARDRPCAPLREPAGRVVRLRFHAPQQLVPRSASVVLGFKPFFRRAVGFFRVYRAAGGARSGGFLPPAQLFGSRNIVLRLDFFRSSRSWWVTARLRSAAEAGSSGSASPRSNATWRYRFLICSRCSSARGATVVGNLRFFDAAELPRSPWPAWIVRG